MAQRKGQVEISVADAATAEVVEAFARLLPQLSSSAIPLTREALTDIIASPHNTVLLARDPSAGGRIVGTLTLLTLRIPTSMRAWIAHVALDRAARGRRAGAAPP